MLSENAYGWQPMACRLTQTPAGCCFCTSSRLRCKMRCESCSAFTATCIDTLGFGETRLNTVRFATGPKRSMGHVLGAKKDFFLIRGRGRPTVYGGRAGLILSIPAQEVSLGSPRVGTIHVQTPTPQAPPLQAFLADFSQQTTGFSHL